VFDLVPIPFGNAFGSGSRPALAPSARAFRRLRGLDQVALARTVSFRRVNRRCVASINSSSPLA
jgi:hypothetical protein